MRQLKNDRMLTLKNGSRVATTRYLSDHLAIALREEATAELASLIGRDAALVPVPKSSLPVPGGLWVPDRVARAMVSVGLGSEVLTCVKRVAAVPKAATAAKGQRPTPQRHFDSLQVEGCLHWPSRIVLVDDIVTAGSTLLGVASRIHEVSPNTEIVAFGMMRTISDEALFEGLKAPVTGTITLKPWGSQRSP